MKNVMLFLLLSLAGLSSFAQTSDVATEIQAVAERSQIDELRWPDFTDYRKHVVNFYGPRGYDQAWMREGRVTPQALAVIDRLKAAAEKGINPIDYDAPRWDARVQQLNRSTPPTQLALFDVALTATLMRYISDLHIGRINPRNISFDLDIEHKKYYLPALVEQVAVSSDVNAFLSDIEPLYDGYRRLLQVYADYRALVASGDQKLLVASSTVRPGGAFSGAGDLAAFLRRTGDLRSDAPPPGKKYEGSLVEAVKKFQRRHGLSDDGTIGKSTLRELNVPLSRRLRQIELALERWRWAPAEFARPPIIVNIPEFRLRALDENEKLGLSMNVVVGQAFAHETPVFESEMKYLVFRPYWNVPPSIQRKEIVPKLEKDPSFLSRNHYEIVDDYNAKEGTSELTPELLADVRAVRVQLRQKPGPWNALGAVKFMFPNRNNVYLHSTPSQELFSRSRRDFSHGCIRVERPADLAAWVLREQPQWTKEKIAAALKGDPNVTVVLPHPIPVLILYSTVVVMENGEVRFFEDIYGHDAKLENALAAGYPYPA